VTTFREAFTNTDVRVAVGQLSEGGLKKTKILSVENNIAIYRETFHEKGNYTLITIGEIRDQHRTVLRRDSIKTYIKVVD
jgi:hypothetical protein